MTLTIGSIVLASVYFVVAWITKKTSIGFDRRERVLWTAIPIALALLGINKLFEGALTNVGRMVAFDQGWYAHRRVFQIWLIASVLAICSIGAIVLLLSARQASLSTRLALSATIMLLALGLMRDVSLHQLDHLIGERIMGLKLNWLLDVGGLGLVLLAHRRAKSSR
jgi:hypothetical protein